MANNKANNPEEIIANMKLSLEIDLGSAAMLESSDLARALRAVADRIESQDYVRHVAEEGGDSITRGIRDDNGNNVGEWILSNEE